MFIFYTYETKEADSVKFSMLKIKYKMCVAGYLSSFRIKEMVQFHI